MKVTIKIFIILAIILLAGCATCTYVEPSSASGIATIQGFSQRQSLAVWDSVEPTFVDDKSLGTRWSESSKFNLLPGEHQVVVSASFNRGFSGNGPYYAIIQVSFVAEPNAHYIVRSAVHGTKIEAWVENIANNQRVSSIESQPYQIVPKEEIISAPVFVTK